MTTYSTCTVTATLVSGTAYSALEIKTPATTGFTLRKWWVEFNGGSTTGTALVQIGLFNSAVTTNTAGTVQKVDWGIGGLASQCTVGINATAEGSGTFNAGGEQHYIPGNSSLDIWDPDAYCWQIPASSFWRIRITPAGTFSSVTAIVGATWTE